MNAATSRWPNTDEIERLREKIENVDDALVHAIARRCALAQALGAAKQARGLPVIDPAREAAVVRRAAENARAAAIDEEAVRHIFWCLIDMSRRCQVDARAGRDAAGDAADID